MRMLALPATVLVLAVAACDGGPTNPLEFAPPVWDVVASAVPGNDLSSGATAITLPFSEILDTSEATTDADDAQLNASCGAPATDASVWYTFTLESDADIVINVAESDYSAGVAVGVGSPGNLSIVTCGPGTVIFNASALTTYYVLVFDDQFDGTGNGGLLSISISEIVAPTVDALTVDPFGTFDPRSGIATISGTYTCSNGDFLFGSVTASQTAGRFTISGSGSFFGEGTCDGARHPWTAEVFPDNGRFAGGKAMTVTFAFTCGPFLCAEGYVERTVILRGVRGRRMRDLS